LAKPELYGIVWRGGFGHLGAAATGVRRRRHAPADRDARNTGASSLSRSPQVAGIGSIEDGGISGHSV
jgi:hypothetical protein